MTERELRRHVRRFLATGDHDPMGMVGGSSMLDGFRNYGVALLEALLAAVQRQERGRTPPPVPPGFDAARFAAERAAASLSTPAWNTRLATGLRGAAPA